MSDSGKIGMFFADRGLFCEEERVWGFDTGQFVFADIAGHRLDCEKPFADDCGCDFIGAAIYAVSGTCA